MKYNFNPRSHEGSDFHFHLHQLLFQSISIHAPTKGATISNIMFLHCKFSFQSTLPRRERLFRIRFLSFVIRISIHAPTKGATMAYRLFDDLDAISIHAPTKGATSPSAHLKYPFVIFQSTLPRRERRLQRFLVCTVFTISIHAPTKGATFPTLTNGSGS